MNKHLETILKELNPINDLDGSDFYSHLIKNKEYGLKDLPVGTQKFLYSYAKPIVRGGTVGAIIGATTSYIMDYPIVEGTISSAIAFAMIDLMQYKVRGLHKYFTEKKS